MAIDDWVFVDDDDVDDEEPLPKSECMLYELYSLVGAGEELVFVVVVDFGVFPKLECVLKLIDLLLAVVVDIVDAALVWLVGVVAFELLPLALLRLPPAAPPVELSSNDTFSNSRNIRLRGETCC